MRSHQRSWRRLALWATWKVAARSPARWFSAILVVPIACVAVLSASCSYLDLVAPGDGCGSGCCDQKVCKNPSVMALAHDLDHLEKHIDRYGSVVAQQPSVWGQARMTKHREDFENQMAV